MTSALVSSLVVAVVAGFAALRWVGTRVSVLETVVVGLLCTTFTVAERSSPRRPSAAARPGPEQGPLRRTRLP